MKKDFSTIIQIGIIVPDAQSVSSNLKRFLGWETQKTWETSRVSGRIYRGEAADFACRMDFFQLPGMELEIIQPLTGPSCWQDYLDENGCGIHHLLFDVNHSADSFAALHAYGIEIEQQGRALPFGDQVFWAYVDSARPLGFAMELTNRREFPKPLPPTTPIGGKYANLLGVSIAVNNLDQTMQNWSHILGWQPEGQPYRIYGEQYLAGSPMRFPEQHPTVCQICRWSSFAPLAECPARETIWRHTERESIASPLRSRTATR